jgi:hypothetical protein
VLDKLTAWFIPHLLSPSRKSHRLGDICVLSDVSTGSEHNITPREMWISQHSRFSDDDAEPSQRTPVHYDMEDVDL